MSTPKRNFTRFGLNMNPFVSVASALVILVLSLYALLRLDQVDALLQRVNEVVVSNFDWVFILSSNVFIIVGIALAVVTLLIVLQGPTLYILRLFIQSVGLDCGGLLEYSTFLSLGGDDGWQGGWTVFYLAW